MEFRAMLKKMLKDFLLIQAGIAISMGILGSINSPAYKPGYSIMFAPFIYAFFCVLPTVVTYSAKEPGIKEMAVRKAIEFILVEAVVLTVSYLGGAFEDAQMLTSIVVASAVIYAAVTFIDYLISKSTADELTEKIKELRRREESAQ